MPSFDRAKLMSHKALWLAGLALLAGPVDAFAQENPLTQPPGQTGEAGQARPAGEERSQLEAQDAQARSPTATEIIRSLAPFADGNPNAPRDQRDVDADGRKNVRVDYRHAIDLTVFFKYDSAELTPEAKIQLEPLGSALRSRELSPYRFLIAGHTDAAGDAVYNLDLSKRRAEAVRRYLITAHDISPTRLLTRGWGAGRLKDADRPLSGVNRRVEVALIVPERQSFLSDESGFDLADAEAMPADTDRGWRIVGRSQCNGTTLVDPRYRLPSDALDDFHGAPTSLCDLRAARARFNGHHRFSAWYDPGRRDWVTTRD